LIGGFVNIVLFDASLSKSSCLDVFSGQPIFLPGPKPWDGNLEPLYEEMEPLYEEMEPLYEEMEPLYEEMEPLYEEMEPHATGHQAFKKHPSAKPTDYEQYTNRLKGK